jgi:hypothetical protein
MANAASSSGTTFSNKPGMLSHHILPCRRIAIIANTAPAVASARKGEKINCRIASGTVMGT